MSLRNAKVSPFLNSCSHVNFEYNLMICGFSILHDVKFQNEMNT